MLSLRRTSLAAVFCLAMFSLAAVAVLAATVTVDAAAKSGKSDVVTLDGHNVKVMGDQVGVHINNKLLTAQQVKVVFAGLNDQNYDVYVDGACIGAKSAGELSAGLDKSIPGRISDPAAMRCIKSLVPKVNRAYDSIHAREGADEWRAAYSLGQVRDWLKSAIRGDEIYRSTQLIIVPAGMPLQNMSFITMRTASETAEGTLNACSLIQDVRVNMYRVLTNPNLRNEVVDALTAVSMSVSCVLKNGKPCVTVSVVNDCDLTITGKISLSDIKGWKAPGAKLDIGKLQSGKTFTTSFTLTPSVKNASPLKPMPLKAVVDIGPKDYMAKLWLFATATCGK
jgi:hypothetical protein